MPEVVNFKVFCLERYKYKHKLNGKEAIRIFNQYGVMDYIASFYDVLHSFGHQYIVDDIDKFIQTQKTKGRASNE